MKRKILAAAIFFTLIFATTASASSAFVRVAEPEDLTFVATFEACKEIGERTEVDGQVFAFYYAERIEGTDDFTIIYKPVNNV